MGKAPVLGLSSPGSAPRADPGFSLVELLIAVLIIGVLIAVALPSFLGARARAQDRAVQALLVTATKAAMLWGAERTLYGVLNGYSGLAMTAVAGAEGCPAVLPAPAPGGQSVNAMCAEPTIPWTASPFDVNSPPGIVKIGNTYPTLCLMSVSANGPRIWYATEGAKSEVQYIGYYTVVLGSGIRVSPTPC